MYTLNVTTYFKKKYKKFARDKKTANKIDNTLNILPQDRYFPSLKTHRVKVKKFKSVWLSRVSGDLRILWNHSKDGVYVLDILDLGGHSGGNKVY